MKASQYLIDVFTRHQVYLERYKASEKKKFAPTLRAIDKMVRAFLLGAGVANVQELSNKELNALIKEISDAEKALLGDYASKLLERNKDLAYYEADFSTLALTKGIKGGAELINAAPRAQAWANARAFPIQATGQLMDGFMSSWTTSQVNAVSAVIRNAHAQGWTMQQTILAVRGTKANDYKDGVLGRMDNETDAVVKTVIQHVSNTARAAVYEANDDIVIGYRWISTLDNRTTQQCRSLDQRIFKLGHGPLPPLHVRCRSTTVPEFDDGTDLLEEGATRASRGAEGGQAVDANLSYYAWLKDQPASFQDSAIGPTRGKLLRDGGLSADEFARLNLGRNFEPLTLPEMRELAPKAFERAGL